MEIDFPGGGGKKRKRKGGTKGKIGRGAPRLKRRRGRYVFEQTTFSYIRTGDPLEKEKKRGKEGGEAQPCHDGQYRLSTRKGRGGKNSTGLDVASAR